jgi:hypothetical protein
MPNTKDQWLTTATVHDEERAALWARVFPQPNRDTPTVPIVSIVPIMVELPEHDTPQQAYQLDLDAITTRQRMRLVDELADRFELEPADVDRDLDKMGVPILATDVTVSSRDQALVMGLDVQPGMLL